MIDFVLPVQRLAIHHCEGVPFDKDFYKSYYLCFKSSQVKMVFDGDYVVKVRGHFDGTWFSRWTEVARNSHESCAVKDFSYAVNKVCFSQEVRHGVWSYL